MKNLIKIIFITGFVFIVSWQVLSIASYTSYDATPCFKNVQQVDLFLADAARNDLNLSLRLNKGEFRNPDLKLVKKLIEEYEALENNVKYKQQSMDEIAALYYWAKDYEAAFEQAKNVLAEYPKSMTASEVLAMCYNEQAIKYISKKNYEGAIMEYENLFNSQVPDGIKASAKFYMGKMYEKKQDRRMALKCYQEIVDEYPHVGWKSCALKKLEDEEIGKNDEAK